LYVIASWLNYDSMMILITDLYTYFIISIPFIAKYLLNH
jgi:hypothetical protein